MPAHDREKDFRDSGVAGKSVACTHTGVIITPRDRHAGRSDAPPRAFLLRLPVRSGRHVDGRDRWLRCHDAPSLTCRIAWVGTISPSLWPAMVQIILSSTQPNATTNAIASTGRWALRPAQRVGSRAHASSRSEAMALAPTGNGQRYVEILSRANVADTGPGLIELARLRPGYFCFSPRAADQRAALQLEQQNAS